MLGFDLKKATSLMHFNREFKELGKVGSGGFSTVHKVKNQRDNRCYALKIVKIKPSEYKTDISDYIDKVLGEVKLLSGLNHPNILKYHGCWIDAELKSLADLQNQSSIKEEDQLELVFYDDSIDSCGFQFAYNSSTHTHSNNNNFQTKQTPSPDLNIFGEDLSKYKELNIYILAQLGENSLQRFVELRNRQQKHPLNDKHGLTNNYHMILDIIQGLSYIHSQNIIHRDLKLQNIIIDQKGKCKIIDFGLAKRVRSMKSMNVEPANLTQLDLPEQLQKHSSSIGTKIYSSPEQTSSTSYDYRTDIYSLAMIIAVMFSDYKTIHEERQLLANIRNKKLDSLPLPPKLKQIILKCLSEQKLRPSLKEIKEVVVALLRQTMQRRSEKGGECVTVLGKYGYVSKNGKMKKRMPFETIKSENSESPLIAKT